MRTIARLAALGVSILFASFVLTHPAHADGLQFSFISPTDQSVVVGSSLTQASFDGFVTNDSLSPITFALISFLKDSRLSIRDGISRNCWRLSSGSYLTVGSQIFSQCLGFRQLEIIVT